MNAQEAVGIRDCLEAMGFQQPEQPHSRPIIVQQMEF